MPRLAALIVALVVSPLLAARTLEPPRAGEKWLTLRADEFHFVSNAPAGKTMEIARDLLRMRAAIGEVTRLKVRSAMPTTVFIFASERAFAPYRDAVLQREGGAAGAFFANEAGNFILLRSDLDDVDRTVYHELTHYFVRNTTTGLPLWIAEGIAEYYSTFGTAGNEVAIGRPVAEHVLWLRNTKLIPLAELFATTTSSPIYNEARRIGAFYSQSWAVFHYLMSDPARRAKFGRFLQLLTSGTPDADAFRAAFGMTYEQLEAEVWKYVRRPAFSYVRVSLETLPIVEPPKPEPMEHADVLAALAHLLVHSDAANAAAAERFLRDALAADPRSAAAHADLGRILDATGRREEADAAYRAVAQLGSGDARVYFVAGTNLMLRCIGKEISATSGDDLRQARAMFRRSTELDPALAPAWAALGATYMTETDLTPGIAALEKSLQLAPGNAEAAFHLLQFYANVGRGEEAQRLFRDVLASHPDARMVAHARKALVLAEVRGIEALMRDGDLAEGRKRSAALLARTTDPELKEYLQRLLGDADRLDAVDTLNRAISAANDRRYGEALQILDRLLPSITDPDVLEEAKKFRAQIAARAQKK